MGERAVGHATNAHILPNIVRDAICGGSGAVLGTYVGMPFDTIKVRLQTSGAETFKSPWHCTLETVRHEGILALWKGSLPALTSALTENLGVSKKTEHFRRWLHYLRYLVSHGFSYVHLVRTFEMHANALTKVEERAAFLAFRHVFFGE